MTCYYLKVLYSMFTTRWHITYMLLLVLKKVITDLSLNNYYRWKCVCALIDHLRIFCAA